MSELASESGSARFRSPVVRWGPYVLLAIVLAVALAISSSRTPKKNLTERTRELATTIKCPACSDESMATSDAPSSVAGRAEIAKRLRAGESSDEIRAYFAGRFGDGILLTPKRSGVDALIWVVPVVAVVVAGGALAAAFVRWHRLVPETPSDDDRDLVERARQAGDGDGDDGDHPGDGDDPGAGDDRGPAEP